MDFNFFDMVGNYENRKVDRYEDKDLIISTAAVADSTSPYETAVAHAQYNNGKFVIVELYPNRQAAKEGHTKWVNLMTAQELPERLVDVSGAGIASLYDMLRDDWRVFPRQIAKDH